MWVLCVGELLQEEMTISHDAGKGSIRAYFLFPPSSVSQLKGQFLLCVSPTPGWSGCMTTRVW